MKPSPAGPLVDLLRQLAGVIEGLDDWQYRAERAPGISGSVGGHVRHCLDHVAALLRGLTAGRMDYDTRVRGTAIESRRELALGEIHRLVRNLGDVNADLLSRPVTLASRLETHGPALMVESSVGRELAFVLSHTTHHLAIVALLLHGLGVSVPPRFGYAPSTPTPALSVGCA